MISCIFFYDNIGSKLFQEITKLPEYYLTRTEIPLIKKAAYDISDKIRNVNIIEFGSGDSTKISILLDAVSKENRDTICYIPFDISESAIKKSSNILLSKYPELKVHGIIADFISQLHAIPKKSKKIICFLGSTIGNLSMEKAQSFLISLKNIMNQEDLLLLGFDMVKSKKILEKAYNDSQNVTEKFNKNILNVINSHINSNFKPENFKHVAFFNEKLSRIEMHLKARKNIEILCPNYSTNIIIKEGETIHTENSYKFTEHDIKKLAEEADLKIKKQYTDKNRWFSLVLLEKKFD